MKQRDIDFLLGLTLLILVIAQIILVILKLLDVGSIGEWNWFAVFTPTIAPIAIAGFAIMMSYIMILSFRK
jgi:hypothetical protein